MLRNILKIYIPIIVVLVFLSFTWQHFRTGNINIKTDNENYIINLTSEEDYKENNGKTAKSTLHTMRASVGVGTYVITIQDKRSVLATKRIIVEYNKTAHYSFKTPAETQTEPVINKHAVTISASNSQISYLDGDANTMQRLSIDDSITPFNENISLQSAQLIDTSYGIGQDLTGTLYEINAASITPLAINQKDEVRYAVAQDRRLFILAKKDLYTGYGSSIKKIATSSIKTPYLVASPDHVAVLNIYVAGEEPSDPMIEVFDTEGNLTAKKSVGASNGAWSPSGNRLAVINYNGESGIYSKTLQKQITLPTKEITAAVWKDDSTLIYQTSDAVWLYSLKTKAAISIGEPVRGSIVGINISDDKQYVYFSTKSTEDETISRIKLSGAKINTKTIAMAQVLPLYLDECAVNYNNFVQPTIIAQPYTTEATNNCLVNAQYKLQSYGLDGIPITVGPLILDD